MTATRRKRWLVKGIFYGGILFLAAIGARSSAVIAAPSAPATMATANNDDAENPYLQLYKLRVEQAELNLHRQESMADLAARKLDRGRRLISSNAISREDYDVLVSEATVTSADRTLAAKKVEEAKAYYRIIAALVKRGVSIPLCTYEME